MADDGGVLKCWPASLVMYPSNKKRVHDHTTHSFPNLPSRTPSYYYQHLPPTRRLRRSAMAATTTSLPATRRAYVIEKYGDAFEQIKFRTDLPLAPLEPHQVRIRVHSAGLNPIDYKMIEKGSFILPTAPSRDKPMTLGMDVAGTVVELGSAAKVDYKVGDAVFGYGPFKSLGTFTDYAVLEADSVIRKPSNVSFNEAAGFPIVGMTSYQALVKKGKLQPGARVLILGGATATGAFAIQIAKAFGASFVAATASPRNVEYVKTFQPDQIIDYTTQQWYEVLDANSIDIIYDCGVEPEAWKLHAHKVLKKNTGVFVTLEPSSPKLSFIFKFILYKLNPWRGEDMPPFEQSVSASPIGASFELHMCEKSVDDLTLLRGLIEQGKLTTPIDSVYPFEQFVDAMKKQQAGKAQGKIILELIPETA